MPGRQRNVDDSSMLRESQHDTPRNASTLGGLGARHALSGGLLRWDRQERDIHRRARALAQELDWHVRARLGTDDHASDIRRMRHRLFAEAHDDIARCDPGAIGRAVRVHRDHERALAASRWRC
jgi:hypothetical protein